MAFPVDEERIEAAERELGRALPQRLRERLRRDHGVVIGSDGSGDLLVLPAGEDEPRVWDHETGDLRPAPADRA